MSDSDSDPSPATPTPSPPHDPPLDTPALYEERKTPGAGTGCFALRRIPAGTRILCESHILCLPKDAGPVELLRGLDHVAPARRDAFWRLVGTDFRRSGNEGLVALASNELRACYDGDEDFEDVRDRMVEAWEKFTTNRFGTGVLGQGTWVNNSVFEKASRLNHSCTPNVFHRFSVTLNKLTIHALRPILPGEELLTSYIDIMPPSAARRATFQNWGFECACPACRAGTHDPERTSLEQKMVGLAAAGYPDTRAGHDAGLLDEVLALMDAIGLNESDTVGDAYEAAAHARLGPGPGLGLGLVDVEAARRFAVRAREVHRVCLGEDSVDFGRVSALLESIHVM